MRKIRIVSLILLVITTVISLDLLFNLLGNLIPEINDGLGAHSFIIGTNIYFGDTLWNIKDFYNAFVISSLITLVIFVENIILVIIELIKNKK